VPTAKLIDDLAALRYGVSVTDGCIDWNTTEALLIELAAIISKS
jgi:3-deoxy-7-phosphoheptulonate synthase